MRLIAITGGIGAGKSVVAQVMAALGYPVYDCDRRARAIMDNDESIKKRIAECISADAIDGQGNIDRSVLSALVFNDKSKLGILNSIVHGAVKADLEQWYRQQSCQLVFVETAILVESGLDRVVDEVWTVVAPKEERIRRVMRRNGLSHSSIEARISSQNDNPIEDAHIIINDSSHSLLLQIHHLISQTI